MGGDLTFTGGAGGVTARHDDLLMLANILDRVGDDFGEMASTLAAVAVSGDLVEAAMLCPVEVARTEAALASAEAGSGGAGEAWLRTEGRAHYLRTVIEAYREVDRALARTEEIAWEAGGFVAGAAAVPLAAVALSNPAADMALLLGGKKLASAAGESLYDESWLQEVLTRSAPGFVQGAAFDLTGGNLGLLATLSGGRWPAADFGSAVSGLISFAGLTGALRDTGAFRVEAVGPSGPAAFDRRQFVGSLMARQRGLEGSGSTVQVVSIDGGRSYVVQVPGTEDWSPSRGDNPMDTTSNVHLMAGDDTRLSRAVVEAMRAAGIPSNAPVMLTGYSQGGIVAASLAADPRTREEFNIEAVVTAGSPIGRMPIPADISVLSLEATEDLVPKLDGVDNPDRATWVTVERELEGASPPDAHHNLGAAHSIVNYEQMARVLDESQGVSISAWRAQNSAFFGSGEVQRFRIVRDVS